ncbi:unnamed protein product [Gordionus sp. m RMFG-2023]
MILGKLVEWISCLLLYICSVFVTHFLCVIFGAPISSDILKTFYFSIYLTSLTLLPSIIKYKLNPNLWINVYLYHDYSDRFSKIICDLSIYTLIGAWLGAFVIPLDWDKPWQDKFSNLQAMAAFKSSNFNKLLIYK